MPSVHCKNLVAGAPLSGREISIRSPWNGALIAGCEDLSYAGAEQALEHAHAAYTNRRDWLPPWRRIEILDRARELVAARAEELAKQSAHEGGKPLIDSRVELVRAIDGLRSAAECVRTMAGTGIPMGMTPSSTQRIAYTCLEPIGVVLAYSAFNHPFNLAVHQIAPAVAAGCPFIIKPAHATPLSCFALVEILRGSGLQCV